MKRISTLWYHIICTVKIICRNLKNPISNWVCRHLYHYIWQDTVIFLLCVYFSFNRNGVNKQWPGVNPLLQTEKNKKKSTLPYLLAYQISLCAVVVLLMVEERTFTQTIYGDNHSTSVNSFSLNIHLSLSFSKMAWMGTAVFQVLVDEDARFKQIMVLDVIAGI
jgi:hypothetical protein